MAHSTVSPAFENTRTDWEPCPEALALAAGGVEVWRLRLERDASISEKLKETLSADETVRAERFRFHRDRYRFSLARAVLRDLLGRYLGRDPAKLVFSYNRDGKPGLASSEGPTIEFNLSHSHDEVLYAFALHRRVGVDIERIRSKTFDLKIAERFFSERETKSLRALPQAQRPRAFSLYWTAKEAYIKARGEGLSSALNQVEVRLDATNGRVDRAEAPDVRGWFVQTLDVGPLYTAALAVEGEPSRVRCYWCASGGLRVSAV